MPLSPEIGIESDKHVIQRCFVLKREERDPQGEAYLNFLHQQLGCSGVSRVRTGVRYDVDGIDDTALIQARKTVFAELPVDEFYDQQEFDGRVSGQTVLSVESLPGQYDQRADFAAQSLQLLTDGERPRVRVANFLVIEGKIDTAQLQRFKEYLINPTDSQEANPAKPVTLQEASMDVRDVPLIADFCVAGNDDLQRLLKEYGLAMGHDDLLKVQEYFQAKGRNPTLTELKVLDTYWSDHCRHTTFTTEIVSISMDGQPFIQGTDTVQDHEETDPSQRAILSALNQFMKDRERLYGTKAKETPLSLMDLALFSMREAREQGKLEDMEASEENNAASIVVPVSFEDGHTEEWLFMFKNETHNHPTEIEPVGGAATCLGGAIRDPLSGRAYVFVGIRVSGSADPRAPIEETRSGKLPQRRITIDAAKGFAGYGNQIGVPTQFVREYYHPGYEAKRLECGFVGGAAKREHIIREAPLPGDVVLLVGGRTGRDGIGGASGSSKVHTEQSVSTSGAEVQKGNPPEEHKLQRFLTSPAISEKIRRCNDFGAGGVAVAVGELADGLNVNLDAVPLKYAGLDGTEIAISESQERMAVVISAADVEEFIRLAAQENLEATLVAEVTAEKQLTMTWRGNVICQLDRQLLNGGWAKREASVALRAPMGVDTFFRQSADGQGTFIDQWIKNLQQLKVASQRGLQQRFDSTVGAKTIANPYGGMYQVSPSEAAVSLFPVEGATTGVAMSAGFDPELSEHSPFHGGMYAIIDSIARLVASGADPAKARLTLQNYFERLGNDAERWGKPFLAQLGARTAQRELVPAIGGKDSMSGTFMDRANGQRLDAPSTLVSFAVSPMESKDFVPSFFQEPGNTVAHLNFPVDEAQQPDWNALKAMWATVHQLNKAGKIRSNHAVHAGGIAAALTEMCAGNRIGAELQSLEGGQWFAPLYGSLIIELSGNEDVATLLRGIPHTILGKTINEKKIAVDGISPMALDDLVEQWEKPLDGIFPRSPISSKEDGIIPSNVHSGALLQKKIRIAQPHAAVLTFPGTNCERETGAALEQAGAKVTTPLFVNLTRTHIRDSIERFAQEIRTSQILVFPGGFSAGDEPDGSGKFIATILRNPKIIEEINRFVERGGLILGICNGFQALVKSCLIPTGKVGELSENSTTLTHNDIGHFLSRNSLHKAVSTMSPWMSGFSSDEIADFPIAHGEGKLINVPHEVWQNGQVPFQYVGIDGNARMQFPDNPNGSEGAAAALTDPTGKIFGMMAHPERARHGRSKNVPGERKGDRIFQSGVEYFS